MQVIQNGNNIKVAVVGCLHGDEMIGRRVFEYYRSRLSGLPGLMLILANEEAMKQGVRFLNDDLNRSFPGSPTGHHEQQLAAELLDRLLGATYVLDLHTTTSDIKMTPIVASLEPDARRIVNLTSSSEIALMEPPIPARALIGHVPAGVSLEFNEDYASTDKALSDITTLVDGLLSDRPAPPIKRKVFHVTGTIPLRPVLPPNARNFQPLATSGVHPFLLHERAYAAIHQGFAATRTSDTEC